MWCQCFSKRTSIQLNVCDRDWVQHLLSVEQLGADTLSSLTGPGDLLRSTHTEYFRHLPSSRRSGSASSPVSLSHQFGLLIIFCCWSDGCQSGPGQPSLPPPGSVKLMAWPLQASPWRPTPASLPPWMKHCWYFYISEQAVAHTSFSSPAHFLPAFLLSLL